jgi:hypothetical protein
LCGVGLVVRSMNATSQATWSGDLILSCDAWTRSLRKIDDPQEH